MLKSVTGDLQYTQECLVIAGNNQNFNVHYRRAIARYKSTIARLGRSWPVDRLGRVDLTKERSNK